MKFSVLSGAYKNAGDFLIVDRSLRLLRHVYPDCTIQMFERRRPLDDVLDAVNQSDALVLAGGPVYSPAIYPNEIPLVSDLSRIRVPIYTMGLGWFGQNGTDSYLYRQYYFTPETRRLLARMQEDGPLTCRDWYSVRALKNNGFTNLVMTGCPAWYDLEQIQRVDFREEIRFPYEKICFSDPANWTNVPQSMEIVRYVREKYPRAKLVFVFHRGIRADSMTSVEAGRQYEEMERQLTRLGVEVRDISYSSDGFHIYDDCDLHIGMRVHAHIYNLSIRNRSILIEEDGRGAGVNEALGLWGIRAYQTPAPSFDGGKGIAARGARFLCRKLHWIETKNPYLINRLDDGLFMLESSKYRSLQAAFLCQRDCFEKMLEHLANFRR